MRSVGTVLALVVLATVVATFARRWRIPAPSLLVVAGLAVALLPGTPDIQISPEIIGLVVLPPLLYASAEELSWRELRVVWKPVGVLSIGLVLASAAAVGAVASLVTPLSWQMALVLGAVLASTDPVAVTALGRRLALPPKVQVLVQAESLFNDATSLVLFRVAVSVAVASAAVGWGAAAQEFALLAGGGMVIGAAVAGVVALIRRRTEDPVLETVISLVTPYAAYVLAEAAHASGVTSVVVAGVVLGGRGDRLTNARIRLQLHAVYGTVIFLLESVVFSLIGLALPAQVRALSDGDRAWPLYALAVAATLIAMRMLWLAPLSAVVQRKGGIQRMNWRVPVVLTWAGTRGVVPLAAALSIPVTTKAGATLSERPLVLVLTTSVVVATLVVQGFSSPRSSAAPASHWNPTTRNGRRPRPVAAWRPRAEPPGGDLGPRSRPGRRPRPPPPRSDGPTRPRPRPARAGQRRRDPDRIGRPHLPPAAPRPDHRGGGRAPAPVRRAPHRRHDPPPAATLT